MEVFKLFGSIMVENDPANKAIDETDKKSKGLTETLGGVVKGAALVGGAVIAAGAAMFAAASKASDYASTLNDMSVRTGIGTDKLQELKFISEQTGVNFDSITNAVGKLTKQMDAAAGGNQALKDTFTGLGVEIQNSDGSLKSMNDVFPSVIAGLANMSNDTERNALAMQLFGKGGMELVPILEQGGVGIEEMTQKARDLGLVMDESAIAAGDQFGDTLDQLKGSLGMVGMEIGTAMMPTFQRLMDWVIKNMPAIKKTFTEVFGAIKEVLTPIVVAFKDDILPLLIRLYEWAKPYLPLIKTIFKESFEFIGSVISGVFNTIDAFITRCQSVYDWAVKAIAKIKEFFSADSSSGSSGSNRSLTGRKAIGGPVAAGSSYLVGENGPEIFTAPGAGTIIPNGAGGGITLHFHDTNIMDDYGVDRLMDRVVDRLAVLVK